MEVMVPMKDSPFGSTASTPYVSAPSSPKRFGDYPFNYYYGSAPTSPTRAAAIYAAAASMVPFNWEEAPGTPKSPKSHVDDDDDDGFEFEFSGQLEKGVLLPELTAADELFEQGKIRPLKPPPRLYSPNLTDRDGIVSSPKSPKGGGLFSPRHRNKVRNKEEEFDPFTAAMVEATRERGRERGPVPSPSSISSSRSRKGSRSLSPMRGGGGSSFMVSTNNSTSAVTSSSAAATKSNSGGGSKKWRLRDLLLFRSASEGRVTGNRSKDPLRKYTILATTNSSSSLIQPPSSDSRNSSFRSTDSSSYGGSSMRRGNMSPHERHYMSNRAAAEESKKKTALPFGRQGLFGCLRFNPAVQSIVRGFHSGSALNRRQ